MPESHLAAAVVEHLERFTYQWSTELELQDAIWNVLQPSVIGQGLGVVQREVSLSPRDRPDFLVSVGGVSVAVEVKIKGSRTAVLRQIGRYTEHDSVGAVVLAAGLRALAAGVPSVIHGKPVLAAFVGGAL